MKFAFCLFKYFPFGGLQRDFLRIAQECLRRGHSVDVFTMHWEGIREPGLTVHLVPVRGWQNHTRSHQFVSQLLPQLASYDLVLGFNKMPGLDVYYAADTCYQAKAHKKYRYWYRFTPRYRQSVEYERAVFQSMGTEILLLSRLQQAEFIHYYQTPASHFHLLPPGIARDRVAPDNAEHIRHKIRKEQGLPPQAFLILMVGSGFKTKGLDRILLACAALPNEIKNRVYLYVIGKDNPTRFKKMATKLGIFRNIKFLGGRHDVPDFLLAADLLVHPAYNENTGTVLLEAIASGLPVLTTDVCGYAEYVREANAGIVLPSPFQQGALNKSLLTMLISDEHAHWKQNGMIFARKADIYSLPQHAVDHLERIGQPQ